jgi:hypothetical protein
MFRTCSTNGEKRNETVGSWRKLHNEELHKFYSSPHRMIKSKRLRWVGHTARMGNKECIQYFSGKARRKETSTKSLMYVGE